MYAQCFHLFLSASISHHSPAISRKRINPAAAAQISVSATLPPDPPILPRPDIPATGILPKTGPKAPDHGGLSQRYAVQTESSCLPAHVPSGSNAAPEPVHPLPLPTERQAAYAPSHFLPDSLLPEPHPKTPPLPKTPYWKPQKMPDPWDWRPLRPLSCRYNH